MANFFTGDELGNIKLFVHNQTTSETQVNTLLKSPNPEPIQCLASTSNIVATSSTSNVSAYTFDRDSSSLHPLYSSESVSFKTGQRHVGLALTENAVISCSNAGVLTRSTLPLTEDSNVEHHSGNVPSRLTDWHLAVDHKSFICGGDEVSPSVWGLETVLTGTGQAIQDAASTTASGKRKRKDELLPGELWRAKNISNDNLGLRQPIRITSMDFVSPSRGTAHDLIVGTQLGDLRRYDTRASKKEIALWSGVVKNGGIKLVKKGCSEHQLFVSDASNGLFSVDLRTGRTLYTYRGLAGSVTSIAPSPSVLATTSLDRYARLHSAPPPPEVAGKNQSERGEVLDKVYMKAIPTVVEWYEHGESRVPSNPGGNEDADVWDELQEVDSDDERERKKRSKRT